MRSLFLGNFDYFPFLIDSRNEDRRDAACAVRGNSSTRKRTVPSDDRARGAGRGGLWNVVVLDLAFYELRSSSCRLISSNLSM